MSVRDEMVERAVRALWRDRHPISTDPRYSFDTSRPYEREDLSSVARTVLEAARSFDGGKVPVDADPSGVLQERITELENDLADCQVRASRLVAPVWRSEAERLKARYDRLESAAREVVEVWKGDHVYEADLARRLSRLRGVLSEGQQ